MKKIILFLFIVLAASFSACVIFEDNEEIIDDTQYPIEVAVTEFSLDSTAFSWTNLSFNHDSIGGGKVLIINSNEDLKNHITTADNDLPEIDFDKNSLLIAYGVAASGVYDLVEKLQQTGKNEYGMHVTIERTYVELNTEWVRAVVVEKISNNPKINLKVELSDNIYPAEIVPTIIAKGRISGTGSGVIPRENIVITKNEDWENLKTITYIPKNASIIFVDEEIDFSKFQLIAVFDEIKMYQGWTIDIINVKFDKDDITLKVVNLKKGFAFPVLSQPFEIVKLPASKKNIVFDMNLLEYK